MLSPPTPPTLKVLVCRFTAGKTTARHYARVKKRRRYQRNDSSATPWGAVVGCLGLPQEPSAVIKNARPPAAWPSSTGSNESDLRNLEVKYAPDLPAVLHDISFSLKARERVGLLGRTGSGKEFLHRQVYTSSPYLNLWFTSSFFSTTFSRYWSLPLQ